MTHVRPPWVRVRTAGFRCERCGASVTTPDRSAAAEFLRAHAACGRHPAAIATGSGGPSGDHAVCALSKFDGALDDAARRISDDRDRVDNVADRAERLTPWECEFLESVSGRLSGGAPLTDAQREKLAQIEERNP